MGGESAFVGSIPDFYDRHMGPVLFEPYALELAQRFDGFSGDILETAAGTGRVTRALIDRVGNARIIATDLNEPMLDKARDVVSDPRVSFRQADACELPFGDQMFDAVICQFGVMFFPDKVKAFKEAKRVLRPQGKMVFSVWDDLSSNELSLIFHETIATCFPDDPPQFLLKGPFSYHEPALIRADLDRAGFKEVELETVRLITQARSAKDIATGLCYGSPLFAEIEARAPGRESEVIAAVEDAFRDHFGSGELKSQGQAIVVTAE